MLRCQRHAHGVVLRCVGAAAAAAGPRGCAQDKKPKKEDIHEYNPPVQLGNASDGKKGAAAGLSTSGADPPAGKSGCCG